MWYSEKAGRTKEVKKRVREGDCLGGILLKENSGEKVNFEKEKSTL